MNRLDNVGDGPYIVRRIGLTVSAAGGANPDRVDLPSTGGPIRSLVIHESNAQGAVRGNLLIRFGRTGDWIPVARGDTFVSSGFPEITFRNLSGSNIVLTVLASSDPEFRFSIADVAVALSTPVGIP